MGLIIILFLFTYLLTVATAPLFKAAGKDPIKAFIPFVGTMELLDIVGRKKYSVIFCFLPISNVFILLSVFIELAKSFDKNTFKDYLLASLFPFVYFPLLGRQELNYVGKGSLMPRIKKSQGREWADAITFAIIAATLIRWSTFEAYTIPTPSMEGSLLVGDYLFVSKMHYGPRTPSTPLQMPLTHQTIWFSDMFVKGGVPSYSSLINLPSYRLPGLTNIKNSDVVVFNFPEEHQYPVDLKTNYIKRCVAIGGDTLKVVEGKVFINNEALDIPEKVQHTYFIHTHEQIKDAFFDKSGINIYDGPREIITSHRNEYSYLRQLVKDTLAPVMIGYIVHADDESAKKLKNQLNHIVKGVYPLIAKAGDKTFNDNLFPSQTCNDYRHWNRDNFGPVVIPKKGMTIKVTPQTLSLYGTTITYYEHNKDVVIKEDNTLHINGKKVDEYTFKQDYYFMMGDNRHNSLDSRYWGYVPYDHVVGKASFIWFSKTDYAGIRFNRIFNMID